LYNKKITDLFLVLALIFGLGAEGWKSADKILLGGRVNLRSSPSFSSSSNNVLKTLTPGTQAKIISYDTKKKYGVGIKVEVTEGPNKGKTGWVYYHKQKARRTFVLQDHKGKEVKVENNFHSFFKKALDYRKVVERAKGIRTTADTPIALDQNPVTKEWYWKRISKGDYNIDNENYNGGPYVPIFVPETQQNGKIIKKRVWVKRDVNQLLDMVTAVPTSIRPRMRPKPNVACEGEEADVSSDPEEVIVADTSSTADRTPSTYQGEFLEGCPILKRNPNTKEDYEQLNLCLVNIKKAIKKKAIELRDKDPSLDERLSTFKAMYLALNPLEQRFAALSLTAHGEAGILSSFGQEEMMAIMKVIDNRVAKAKTHRTDKVNELDIILEPSQFSPYNSNNSGWKNSLNASQNHKWTKRSLNAYIEYQHAQMKPVPEVDQLTFFHANFSNPAWSRKANEQVVSFDGQVPDGGMLKYGSVRKHIYHEFYTDQEIGRTNGSMGYRLNRTPHRP
tara:strand:+ start:47886 stop:49400 length:1515 start_codon:yes stop_codon:yes gene_type:complete